MKTASDKMPIAVLISGNGSNLQALIDAQPQSHYAIQLVICNRPDTQGILRAQNAGIDTLILDHKTFDCRETFDQAMIDALDSKNIEAVILAGFMRILTPNFTRHYLGKLLNIHPSLLPKYPGLDTHQRALEAGDNEHGLSIHFVTEELDGGPVILQAKIAIKPNDTIEDLKQRIHHLEHQAYPQVVEWFATDELKLKNHNVWYSGKPLKRPVEFKENEASK